ncbi:MAG: lysine--tRNA ligase [Actinomycetota bacterium]|nr:lysine--tRNA ligase [Actinomycetota bacterium]
MTDDKPSESTIHDDPLVAARITKHREAVRAGDYPYRFNRTDLAADLQDRFGDIDPGAETGVEVTVAGRLMNVRDMGRLAFGVLQDVSGRIQLFVSKAVLGEEDFARFLDLDSGDWIGATGEVMATKKGELSIRISSFTLLSKALRPLPDKWHGLKDVEARSRQRYVDLMVNEESRKTALTRARIVSEFRRQFESRDFVEVETPVLLSQATGATARPFETHHNALDLDLSLRIATELFLKRLVVGGIERVFEIGRIFRNEGVDATHNPEFTMLEAYQAFADYGDIMVLIEEVLASVAEAAVGTSMLTYQGRMLDLTPPFRRVRLSDLVAEVVDEDVSLDTSIDRLRVLADRYGVEDNPSWGAGRVIYEIYEACAESTIWEPTFVTDYPKDVSPLSRLHRDDPRLTERFELVIAGSEYANAFSELNDPFDQRERFEAQAAQRAAGDDEAHPIDEDYLRALEYGLPPTGGLGIGVDRFVMLLTDRKHIREVILFPTMRPEAASGGVAGTP